MSVVNLERQGHLAIVTVDNPPVNVLSYPVRLGLTEALEEIEAADDIKAAVLVCAGRTFVAGADISEFGKPIKQPRISEMITRIDAC